MAAAGPTARACGHFWRKRMRGFTQSAASSGPAA
eukprot:CAMPEP_0175602474 /NCGR_PEP_ID=MMETSP0096-20121207/58656_1 /TAXON_ID=311494 /ORGANISM="Alexandrium monilatum, Strain CCMP3105" /LENGTH=33 /DNA_ID= /DNA_START= /DNA_END= /DNA_ORIENTATION=